jgi:hypothetical protein
VTCRRTELHIEIGVDIAVQGAEFQNAMCIRRQVTSTLPLIEVKAIGLSGVIFLMATTTFHSWNGPRRILRGRSPIRCR